MNSKVWMWYWMPAENRQHYVKDVTICLHSAENGHTYQHVGLMIMDDFGQLVSIK